VDYLSVLEEVLAHDLLPLLAFSVVSHATFKLLRFLHFLLPLLPLLLHRLLLSIYDRSFAVLVPAITSKPLENCQGRPRTLVASAKALSISPRR
jgi:hypothetical protein